MSVRALLIGFFVTLFALELPAEFRAGAAWRNVTPDPLLPVSGGAGPSHPTSKKLGELTVRALVFEDDGTRVAIVSGDFLGFPAVLADKVRARVPEIPAENILIGATHTHSAPDCYGFPEENGSSMVDLKYLESACVRMAEAIHEAMRGLRPARLKIGSGKAASRIAYNYYAEELYDPRCSVMQVLDAEGRPFATLINYAIHPEVLGANREFSAPTWSALYDRVQERGGAWAFMNGAQGGMVTADCRGPDGKDIQTWAECERIEISLLMRHCESFPAHWWRMIPGCFARPSAWSFQWIRDRCERC
jgi:hypothetical protein